MNKIFFSFLLCLILFVSGCAHKKTIILPEEDAVFSWVQSTQPDSAMTGKATLWRLDNAVKIRVVVTGATPGLHGIHIHEIGDCSDHGNAAGSHFNPDKVQHGNVIKDGMKHAHPGDLGNIKVDSTGMGSIEVIVPGLTLDKGPYGIANRSIVIHEKVDDFGQPTGNAGGRVACAVIPNPLKCDC